MDISPETISLTIGIASFVISIVFFFAARKSEMSAYKTLVSIQEQTRSLERINDNLLSTAIHHLASSNTQLIELAAFINTEQAPSKLIAGSSIDGPSSLIAVYFYIARTVYFASLFKQFVPLSEESKIAHVLADDAITRAKADYLETKIALNNLNQQELTNHHLYPVFVDLETNWAPIINE